jgi:hypothetical protein
MHLGHCGLSKQKSGPSEPEKNETNHTQKLTASLYGWKLKEVPRQDELDTTERILIPSHDPGDVLQFFKESSIHHGDLIHDEHLAPESSESLFFPSHLFQLSRCRSL